MFLNKLVKLPGVPDPFYVFDKFFLGFLVASCQFVKVSLTLNFSLIAWCRSWSLAEQAFVMIARHESLWKSKGGKEQKTNENERQGAGAGKGGPQQVRKRSKKKEKGGHIM